MKYIVYFNTSLETENELDSISIEADNDTEAYFKAKKEVPYDSYIEKIIKKI